MARNGQVCLRLGFLLHGLLSIAIPSIVHAAAPAKPLSYALFAPGRSDGEIAAYQKLLTGDDANISVMPAETLQEGIESKADVLVICLDQAKLASMQEYLPFQLKKRKVIGIGTGAARIFQNCGLKISSNHCAHGGQRDLKIQVVSDNTVDKSKWSEPTTAFTGPTSEGGNAYSNHVIGVYIGDKHPEYREGIEVVAVFDKDRDYAPVTRQFDAILFGFDVPPEKWSDSLVALFRELGPALQRTGHDQKKEKGVPGPGEAILGSWVNVDEKSNGTRRIAIDKVGDAWLFDEWGAIGNGTELVWSNLRLDPIIRNNGATDQPCWITTHDSGFAVYYLILHIENDRPVLEKIAIFKDRSDRRNYRMVYKFKKEVRPAGSIRPKLDRLPNFFSLDSRQKGEPGKRIWVRTDAESFVEYDPRGQENRFRVIKSATIERYEGVIVQSSTSKLQAFVPYSKAAISADNIAGNEKPNVNSESKAKAESAVNTFDDLQIWKRADEDAGWEFMGELKEVK